MSGTKADEVAARLVRFSAEETERFAADSLAGWDPAGLPPEA
ncbi:hypothetical protein P4H65_23245 [Paenibacillus chitinolyticus]|nr:hypothetical protein [Paenibacillus chitinolyticus]MEC0248710.1 hypothetical protein [Paenibacillus chitinolyticus]